MIDPHDEDDESSTEGTSPRAPRRPTDRPSISLDRSLETYLGGESREFRVSIPDFALDDFRTKAWTRADLERQRLEPYHPTLTHAFAYLERVGGDTGVTLLPER